MKKLAIVLFALTCFVTVEMNTVNAQYVRKSPKQSQQGSGSVGAPSQTSLEYARRVANTCSGNRWEEQACLKAVSENVYVMASNYGATLQQRGKKAASEKIKEHCAAATAATQGEYPAYAMRSAFVECANMISDMVDSTRMSPDLSQYQLLVGAVQCLDKSTACMAIESGLKRYQ